MTTRILVLGGTGMLGGMVASVLSREPQFFVESTQRARRDDRLFFNGLPGSPTIEKFLASHGRWDLIANCIGLTKPAIVEGDAASMEAARIINSELPHRLVEAAALTGTRVIHISTDGVFSGCRGPYDEGAIPDPIDLYGRSKLAGEIEGSNALTLRCSIIGPDPLGRRGLFEWFRALPPGSRIPGFTDHLWNGVTTRQFAELCRSIALSDSFDRLVAQSSIRHFCPNRAISKFRLLEIFKEKLGSRLDVVPQESGTSRQRVLSSRWNDLLESSGRNLDIADAVAGMLEGEPTNG